VGRADVSGPYDLLVAGRPSVDVMFTGLREWPQLGNDIEADGFGWCAGTAFNTPAAANRIGLRVAFVATVGNDIWSDMIREEFEAEGVPTDFLQVEDRPLPGVSVSMNMDGDRGFITHWGEDAAYDEAMRIRALEVAEHVDARHLHAYVDDEPELVAAARRRGMSVSLDAWAGRWFWSATPLDELLGGADVLFANEDEATAMSGERHRSHALRKLAEHCPCVVIKCGGNGAIGMAGGEEVAVPADPVELVDTTGAGDAFNAGFLAGWLSRLELEASLTLGVICGSAVVSDYGGYWGCPLEADLREIAAARGIWLPSFGRSA
jgi:sugar/nucleoside kinase (ribokinase family)